MKGIYPADACHVCARAYQYNKAKERYECPDCKTRPLRYRIKISFKGKRIDRCTNLEGVTLRSIADAHALIKRADSEKAAGKFDIEKWLRKDNGIFNPARLYRAWYKGKLKALKKDDLKPSYTVKLRSHYRVMFRPYALNNEIKDIREIKSLVPFFDSLPDRLSAKYRKNIAITLSTFFRWCHKEMRVIDEIPVMPKIKVPRYIPTVLDQETRLYIVDNFILPQHRPIFGFYVMQGCRPGEVIALKGDCIKSDNQGVYIEYKRTFSDGHLVEIPKDEESRAVPLFKQAEKYMPAHTFPNKFIFTNKGKIYTLSVLEHQLIWALKRYNKHMQSEAEKSGAKWEPIKIKLYEFGKHSRSSELYEAGASLQDLQMFHGHSQPQTSMLYTKIDVLKRFRKMDNVTELKSKTVRKVSVNEK